MRLLQSVLALVIALGLGLPHAAQADAAAPDLSIKQVITAQIIAFEAGDVDAAFTHASPRIQSIFGTSDRFGTMVREGYPMVWNPTSYAFLEQEAHGTTTWQRLRFTDASGQPHWFAYEMIEVDGRWRINGVFALKPPGMRV